MTNYEQALISDEKGDSVTNALVGVMIAIIIGVGVAIPVTQDVTVTANLTGLTLTIVNFLPVLIGVVLLVAVAALISG